MLNDLDSQNGKNRQQDVSGQGSGDDGQPETSILHVDLPKVMEYYFGLVELTLPAEGKAAVKEPRLDSQSYYSFRPKRASTTLEKANLD
ncbi:unnamed protein product [Fusarium venenatum]|uniref:Uncharacterized protein n=1 Tax=Fusarium venenatum TaxID=56646 RepID=A0A2L2TS23_9HYPO|nr:uncharacterized protein FVRRES_00322 [Fusarium venenatum]CEI63810.1 unnamed protein product [Fusarium venenatum]